VSKPAGPRANHDGVPEKVVEIDAIDEEEWERDRHTPQVLVAGERVEGLRVLALVGVVARDGVAHLVQVLAQHRFLGLVERAEVARDGEREEQRDHREHHEELDQREAAVAHHHSLSGRPLMPTRVEREKTSKTSSPSRGSSGGLA